MNLSLEYKIQEPKVILDKNPLLLLLHGYGSNEADLFSFATELHDAGTSDYITGLLENHEKMAWMLRAHLN